MTTARNQRVARTVLSPAIALALCLISVGKAAPAAEQIDQNNLPEWRGGWTHANPTGDGAATMWQTFTPACPNLTAVEIDIRTVSPGQGDDVLTVEIARDGAVLASAACSVTDGFDGLWRFEFPEAVPLVPEQIYELKVRDTGRTRFGWKFGSNTYERGSRYLFAQQNPNTDWFFRTYARVEAAAAKYSGGAGEPNDPYQIATADDLLALGNEPNDYDKHFILTADIDLDPNLPGRKVFDKAVIAPDANAATSAFEGTPFTGVLNGNRHTIAHLTITGRSHIGLFGQLGLGATIRDLGVLDVNIAGSGSRIGGLAGTNGDWPAPGGIVAQCYTTGSVSGAGWGVGGLVGYNGNGSIVTSFSRSSVRGGSSVGGLVGSNSGSVATSYSTGSVSGADNVGGLVGESRLGSIATCYSAGPVSGTVYTGGLIGNVDGTSVTASFWDIETSGQMTSPGGTGKTRAEMQTAVTFLDAGWDFVDEVANGTEDIWWILEGQDYPKLWWERQETVRLPVIELEAAGFDDALAEGVILVDLYATWCSHCTTQAPILEEVADRLEGRARVAKLDIDKARPIAERYGVAAVPTLILFQDGVEVTRFVGVTGADVLVAAILSALNAPAPPPGD